MKNGKFTPEEISRLLSLDAVDDARPGSIVYSKEFKRDCMERYRAGESPAAIFASAGLPSSLIGYKRIERAIYHWKEAERKDALCATDAPSARRDAHLRRVAESRRAAVDKQRRMREAQVESLKREKRDAVDRQRRMREAQAESLKQEKRDAVERQRGIRDRKVAELEGKLRAQKQRAKTREERLIAAQAAEIAALKAQVRALKANGTLAKKTKRTPHATAKSERFELIFQLRNEDPSFNVSAACEALEVSRRGYYDWVAAAPARAARDRADDEAFALVRAAFCYRGFKKGTRQIRDCLARRESVTMNRKKIIRLERKYGLTYERKRKNPYRRIGPDGLPKVADNVVNRDFRRGGPLKVISTDITYLPCAEGFSYLSGIIDCETNVLLAHAVSRSLEERFVLDTYDQLKGLDLPCDIWACSDQGVHYTARAYREKLAELGINQSMSRRACCWDNAPIESFWGRMKSEIGPTGDMTHDEVESLVDSFIDYYNNERGQERLGWLTPAEYAAKLAV